MSRRAGEKVDQRARLPHPSGSLTSHIPTLAGLLAFAIGERHTRQTFTRHDLRRPGDGTMALFSDRRNVYLIPADDGRLEKLRCDPRVELVGIYTASVKQRWLEDDLRGCVEDSRATG